MFYIKNRKSKKRYRNLVHLGDVSYQVLGGSRCQRALPFDLLNVLANVKMWILVH